MSMLRTLRRALTSSGMSAPDSIYEVDEAPPIPPRFDLPLQLENRGTTTQESAQQKGYSGQIHQMLLWSKLTVHKNSTAAKLRSIGRTLEAEKLERCHTVFTVAQCK